MVGSEPGAEQDCACVTRAGAWRALDERYLGTDRTNGRFADVTLRRCASCGRLWLRYQLEYEAFSRSGRWAEGVIDAATAAAITPESAAGLLAELPWHVYGGSWFGHAGKRGAGPVPWDVVCEGPS